MKTCKLCRVDITYEIGLWVDSNGDDLCTTDAGGHLPDEGRIPYSVRTGKRASHGMSTRLERASREGE